MREVTYSNKPHDVRQYTEKVRPPRTIFLRWPFGHPLGEPFNIAQQRAVLMEMFNALYSINKPGEIIDLPYKWKKEQYDLNTNRKFVNIQKYIAE